MLLISLISENSFLLHAPKGKVYHKYHQKSEVKSAYLKITTSIFPINRILYESANSVPIAVHLLVINKLTYVKVTIIIRDITQTEYAYYERGLIIQEPHINIYSKRLIEFLI